MAICGGKVMSRRAMHFLIIKIIQRLRRSSFLSFFNSNLYLSMANDGNDRSKGHVICKT